MLMSVCGHTGMKEGKEMNVKYMNELPADLKERKETKTSKLLAVMQDFMARPEPIMEVTWEETFNNVTSAVASARSAIRSNKLALRVTRCQNRLFIQKETADAE